MEHNDQLHVEAEEALANINKKTGRNMPQAVATGAVLVIIILASLLIRIDVFVLLIVVFMVLALWELRVDFATVGLHIPVVALWLCSAAILLGTARGPIIVQAAGHTGIVNTPLAHHAFSCSAVRSPTTTGNGPPSSKHERLPVWQAAPTWST